MILAFAYILYPKLKDAIDDLLQIFPFMEKKVNKCYKKYKKEPAKWVTMIWTSSTELTKLINFSLIIDAWKNFKFDKSRLNCFRDYISVSYIIFNLILRINLILNNSIIWTFWLFIVKPFFEVPKWRIFLKLKRAWSTVIKLWTGLYINLFIIVSY